jgi:hypothetical protein
LCKPHASPHTVCKPHASPHTVLIPMQSVIPRPHASTDHKYNSLPFSIQNSNSYSFTSQTFMLQGSHMGPRPVIPWGGSPAAGQPLMWLPPSHPAGYWPPPPLAGHPIQCSSTPPPPSSQRYWLPSVGTSSWRASPVVGNA